MTDANNERAQAALPDYPDTFGAPETETTITERFDKIVALHANRLAIDDGRRALTYGEARRGNSTGWRARSSIGSDPQQSPWRCSIDTAARSTSHSSASSRPASFNASLDAELTPNRLSLLLENLGARLLLCHSACEPLARSLANTSPGTAVLANTEAAPPATA